MANSYIFLQMEESPRYESAPTTAPYRISTTGVFLPTTAGRINANPSYIDRSAELRNIPGAVADLIDTFAPDGAIAERAYINHLAFLLSLSGLKATITPGDGTNQVWTLNTTAATAGTYTLTVNAQTTAALPWNATVAQIQAALEALSTVGVGNVAVTGGPIPGANVVITFRRALGAQVVTLSGTFTGLTGTPYTLTNTTPGVNPTVHSPDFATGDTYTSKPTSFVGVGSYLYQFAKRFGAQAQTAQIIAAYGDMGVWLKGQGFGVSQLSLNAAGELSTNLLGLVLASVADPALSPVLDSQSVLPARRGNLTLTWLTGGGTVDDFTLQVDNPLQAVRSLGLATPSLFPDVMEVGDTWPRATGTIPKRRINATDVAALLAGSIFSASARWRLANYVADSASQYGLWFVAPSCMINQMTPDDLQERRRFGASYNWTAFHDETAGYDFQFSLVCGVSAAALSSPFTI